MSASADATSAAEGSMIRRVWPTTRASTSPRIRLRSTRLLAVRHALYGHRARCAKPSLRGDNFLRQEEDGRAICRRTRLLKSFYHTRRGCRLPM
eukprot:scaffold216957_cov27-Tisochrysis_lutea.AAC.3